MRTFILALRALGLVSALIASSRVLADPLQAGPSGCVGCDANDVCQYVEGSGHWRCNDGGGMCSEAASCSWNAGGCFIAGTQVSTPSGFVPIEQLKVGDDVQSVNSRGEIVLATVTKTFRTIAGGYLLLNGRIGVTKDHPFNVAGEWLEVGSISIGDELRATDGLPRVVHSIEPVAKNVRVFNIEVGGDHTFLVQGVLVHNKATPGE